jgi:hypothetical protein
MDGGSAGLCAVVAPPAAESLGPTASTDMVVLLQIQKLK